MRPDERLKARIQVHDRFFQTYHAPILALDERLDKVEQESRRLAQLAEVACDPRAGHERRAVASNALAVARDRKLARLAGDQEPPDLVSEAERRRCDFLLGRVRGF